MSGQEEAGFAAGGVTHAADVKVDLQEWGRLEWMVSNEIGNSDTLTVGKCFIIAGRSNPPHFHPNCDEVLHVLSGTIRHRVENEHLVLHAGDTISIPQGAIHQAENIGDGEAELFICFSTADRQVVGE